MNCPNCGLFNPSNATVCDCGYNFENEEPPRQTEPRPSGVTWQSVLLGVVIFAVIRVVLLASPTGNTLAGDIFGWVLAAGVGVAVVLVIRSRRLRRRI